jgi:hypothetical protein
MDKTYNPPVIDIIANYAMAGLLHGRRNCQFCLAQMRIIKAEIKNDFDIGYVWVCPRCFKPCNITEYTPLHSMNLKMFNLCLSLFARGFFPVGQQLLVQTTSAKSPYFQLIRKSMGHYWSKKVLPYIRLKGPVEMDETLISRKRWTPIG